MNMLKELTNRGNLNRAYKQVFKNRGSGGIDMNERSRRVKYDSASRERTAKAGGLALAWVDGE